MDYLSRFFSLGILLLVTAGIYSCTNNPTKETQQDSITKEDTLLVNQYLITCNSVGIISKKDKELQLRMKFGETAVTRDSFFLEGAYQEMITVIHKGKAEELKVHWNNHGQIKMIVAEQQQSPYHFSNGIRMGTTLAELEEINHNPVSFYGFGWDYGGSISTFNQGIIEKEYPCFSGVLTLDHEISDKDIPSDLLGDEIFTTEIPGLNKYDICLKKISVLFN